MEMNGLPDISPEAQRLQAGRLRGAYQTNHEYTCYNYYVTLLCMNCALENAKQLKAYS